MSPSLGGRSSGRITACHSTRFLSCTSNAFGGREGRLVPHQLPPPFADQEGYPSYLRAVVRRRLPRLPPRAAICVPPSLRVASAEVGGKDGVVDSDPCRSPDRDWLRRRGAKASSAVSGMSQDRGELLRLCKFFLVLARMSRRNFRG